jgi:hypothetical protein
MEDYTFSESRYITRGIANDLPAVLIMYLWQLIDERVGDKNLQMDYLQVFDLVPKYKDEEPYFSITHRQEVPPYKREHLLKNFVGIKGKVYVIDDIDYVTMMWADEY